MEFLANLKNEFVEGMHIHKLAIVKGSSYDLVGIRAHRPYPEHFHKKSKAVFYIIYGEGKIILNGKKENYLDGSVFSIPRGMKHGFEPLSDTLFLSIQTPPIKHAKTGKEDVNF
ncbi:cupin domain-containing protein [Candidatus Pacearchaeota archaeon]|nr:cupin domain-containing protein [Candidatus Pacearchaeota archaeon]